MIERLRRKFIIIAMSSLMLIIVTLIGIINAINLYHIERRTDGAINMIAENEGEMPEFGRHKPKPSALGLEFQFTPETVFETRYFTANITEDGEIDSLNTERIAAVNADEALAYAKGIIESGKVKGYKDHYKYMVIDKPYGAMLIVLDCRGMLQAAAVMFKISCAAAVLSLAAMFFLVSSLSKRALKPVQISLEKQKQFITDAGHEIKTPLAIISSNADVLEIMNGESEWLKSIRNQTGRLDELVKQLLLLSKLEEETAEKTWADFNFSNVLLEVVSEFRPMADSRGRVLVRDILPDLTAYGDAGEIRRMLAILLDNAIKYAPPAKDIKISLYERGKTMVFEIRNYLSSPPEDEPDILFDRFYRAEVSRSRESGGYGIGLSIAKSVVENHNGDIKAFYEDGNTVICFRITLPKKTNASRRRV